MKEKVIQLLKEGKNVKEIREILQISEHNWRKLGLTKIDKYNNIFKEITEESAYWLGFLWADGSLSKNVLELEINTEDEHHLQKLVNSLSYISTPTIYRRTRHNASTSRIAISNKSIANSLRELGFGLKWMRIVPNIPDDMMIHFIRGYFDGDGSFQLRVHNGNEEWRADISGPAEFVEYIQPILPEISYSEVINNKTWTSKRIYWTGKEKVLNLLSFISKNSSIKLERKYTSLPQ